MSLSLTRQTASELNFSTGLQGVSPTLVSIDGGVIQTSNESFDYNGESDLDLEFGMTLVTKSQNLTLYQVGDIIEGTSFNNFLDALDGTYCTYGGGDDPTQDAVYPDNAAGGYKAMFYIIYHIFTIFRFIMQVKRTAALSNPRT